MRSSVRLNAATGKPSSGRASVWVRKSPTRADRVALALWDGANASGRPNAEIRNRHRGGLLRTPAQHAAAADQFDGASMIATSGPAGTDPGLRSSNSWQTNYLWRRACCSALCWARRTVTLGAELIALPYVRRFVKRQNAPDTEGDRGRRRATRDAFLGTQIGMAASRAGAGS